MDRTRFAAAILVILFATAGSGGTGDNGVFRFLTTVLPEGSTNAEYVARVVTANADGPVTFTMTDLPPGTAYDAESGYITGRPTVVNNYDVDISAFDGTNTIVQNNVRLKVSAAGGGGNEGATFNVGTLPDGEVGTVYATSVSVTNGVGPYTYCAADLPPGLRLRTADPDAGTPGDETGEIEGTPLAPGRYFVSLTVYDEGESNKVVKIVPLLVDPADSDFRFTTRFLNNGEVGTTFYDRWYVSGAAGPVTFGASGLPPGVVLDPATGILGGSPSQAGTFLVNISASDGDATLTTNLTTVVAPSASSSFYFDVSGLPAGRLGVDYGRQPPIVVATKNGGTVTYAAVGVPAGMTFNTSTGELAGTPAEMGEYPVVFTATDSDSGEVITLALDFYVLPPGGGDTSAITTNLWVSKQSVRCGNPGGDSWSGQGIFNMDRRAANRFDPAVDGVRLQIGSHALEIPAGGMSGTAKSLTGASPPGETPVVKVQMSLSGQTLKWSSKSDTISEVVPATLRHTTVLGRRGYRLDEAIDAGGAFRPALAYRRAAFVFAKGALTARGAEDSLKGSLFLADPAFDFEPGVSTLRFRILSGPDVLFTKEFTALGAGTSSTTPAGVVIWKIRNLADPDTANRLAKFSYDSAKGKMTLALSGMALAGVPTGEAHLGLELTIGDRTWYTAVTFFEGSPGSYGLTMP